MRKSHLVLCTAAALALIGAVSFVRPAKQRDPAMTTAEFRDHHVGGDASEVRTILGAPDASIPCPETGGCDHAERWNYKNVRFANRACDAAIHVSDGGKVVRVVFWYDRAQHDE